jgi:peptidoglycan hydrolase CwlO-like protein
MKNNQGNGGNMKRTIKWLLPLALATTYASVAFAESAEQSKIQDKIEQMKSNSENSQLNLDQYKNNLETVQGNVKELDKAIANLRDMRHKVLENSKK